MGALASFVPWAVVAWLFLVGTYGIVTSRNLIHLVGALSVVQASTYVLLVAIGFREDAHAPFFADVPPGTPVVDPIVQSLALTDIVVGATVYALLLALAVRAHARTGTLDPEALRPMHGPTRERE